MHDASVIQEAPVVSHSDIEKEMQIFCIRKMLHVRQWCVNFCDWVKSDGDVVCPFQVSISQLFGLEGDGMEGSEYIYNT